jgi:hypothetical protein
LVRASREGLRHDTILEVVDLTTGRRLDLNRREQAAFEFGMSPLNQPGEPAPIRFTAGPPRQHEGCACNSSQ